MKFAHFSTKFAQLFAIVGIGGNNYRVNASLADPATDYVPITYSDDPLPDGPCRTIRCSEDGALNLTTLEGVVRPNVPVFSGDNPLVAAAIDEPTTGTAPASSFALY